MPTFIEVNGLSPTIGEDVWIAPTAVLVGDVRVGDHANVWFGAVLRADYSHIEVGAGTSLQDNCVVHCAEDLPTVIGPDVVVGHGAMLEGCVIEEHALIGMGAIVLQRARVGARAMVAAGAVVGEGAAVGGEMLAAGVPAREKKPLSGSALRWTDTAVGRYRDLSDQYLTTSRVRAPVGERVS
jgi:carbonic anhydrase/acetyltransferase-like protein (isoleucine patch superfamily)